jgi:hypothetical protein
VSGTPKIPEGPDWQPVRVAFARYKLDPRRPDHWIELVRVLVLARIPPGGKITRVKEGGRPGVRWDRRAQLRLLKRFEILRNQWPKARSKELYNCLATHPDYKGCAPTTLQRQHTSAKRNPELKELK